MTSLLYVSFVVSNSRTLNARFRNKAYIALFPLPLAPTLLPLALPLSAVLAKEYLLTQRRQIAICRHESRVLRVATNAGGCICTGPFFTGAGRDEEDGYGC